MKHDSQELIDILINSDLLSSGFWQLDRRKQTWETLWGETMSVRAAGLIDPPSRCSFLWLDLNQKVTDLLCECWPSAPSVNHELRLLSRGNDTCRYFVQFSRWSCNNAAVHQVAPCCVVTSVLRRVFIFLPGLKHLFQIIILRPNAP